MEYYKIGFNIAGSNILDKGGRTTLGLMNQQKILATLMELLQNGCNSTYLM